MIAQFQNKESGLVRFLSLQIIIIIVCVNCSSQSAFNTGTTNSISESTSTTTSSEVLSGNINLLDINNNVATLDLNDIADDDELVVVLFNYSQNSNSAAFQIGATQNASLYLQQDKETNNQDINATFHNFLREQENNINTDAQYEPLTAHSRYLQLAASVGSEKEFQVISSMTDLTYTSVTATLRYTNDAVEFYVDNRNADSINDDELEELAQGFMISEMNDLFGQESDVDGNGKFAVLFSQTVNELGAMSGGIISGFFYATDLFSSELYENSNEMEVFYTLVPDKTGEFGTSMDKDFALSNIYPTVLPHEYQHMINFNQHYFNNEGSIEESWLNEGLSHLAEDIYSVDNNSYMTNTSIENPARVATYLASIQNVCFSCGSNLQQRGGSYLFLRYLYEQAELGQFSNLNNGADFIASLLDTTEIGYANLINTLFGADGQEQDLQTVLGHYALALYLSNTDTSSDERFNFTGINLRADQTDNRNTILNGPALQDVTSTSFTDTLVGTSISYLRITGSDILENGSSLNFSFAQETTFGGYVIQP